MARIFISHSKHNNAEALALWDWLVSQGWNDLFLDIHPTDGLVAGDRWQEALRASIGRCRAVIFCISQDWCQSPNCRAEFDEAMRVGAAPVGVIIKPTPRELIPNELRQDWQFVDLARGGTPVAFDVAPPPERARVTVSFPGEELLRLRAGLARLGLAGFDTKSFPWPPAGEPKRAPYRGLAPFEATDAGIFFGRDSDLVRAREELIGLREKGGRQFFVILGSSGAGKSSFLRAGVLPRIEREDREFLVLPVIRPRSAAISGEEGLATCLEQAFKSAHAPGFALGLRDKLLSDFDTLPPTLEQLISLSLGQHQDGRDTGKRKPPTVILAVDQAEELFTPEGAGEARRFLQHMTEALRRGPETIVLATIRSDRFEPLQEAATRHNLPTVVPFHLGPVTAFSFRESIVRPAERADPPIELDSKLVDALIANTASQGADPLPLLSFTLQRLFLAKGEGSKHLSLKEYEETGGLSGSIDAALKEAFADPERVPVIPADPIEQDRVLEETFFPALADINPENDEPVRRIAAEVELPHLGQGVAARLVDRRLLVRGLRTNPDGRKETTIEVAHEALLRQWPTLRRILDRRAADLKAIQIVERSAQAWNHNGRKAEWIEHRGARLQTAEDLSRVPALSKRFEGVQSDYLKACRQAENVAQRRQKRIRQYLTYGALGVLGILTVLSGLFAAVWRELQVKDSLNLTSLARNRTEIGDLSTGALVALEGLPDKNSDNPFVRWRPYVPEAEYQLYASFGAVRELAVLGGHKDVVRAAALSPDGTTAATASFDGTARLWDTATGKLIAVLEGHKDKLSAVSFDREGKRIVTASYDSTARVWNAKTGEFLIALIGHEKSLWSAEFDSRGTRILTSSDDGTARIFDAATGKQLAALRHDKEVNSAAFSPDGTIAVTASVDGTARIWTTESGAPVATLSGHDGIVWRAIFSPDGSRVATGGEDGTARIWEAATGTLAATAKGHEGRVISLAFRRDGRRLLTASQDATARLWDTGTGEEIARLKGHYQAVGTALFDNEGQRILTASDDGTARLWEAENGRPIATLAGHANTEKIASAAFSTDGAKIITASADATARIWRADVVRSLKGHGDKVSRVAVSADGRRAVSASWDKTVRIWDIESGKEVAKLDGHQGIVWRGAFSADGQRLLSASEDKTARLWDAVSGRELAVFSGHSERVGSAEFSPGENRIVTASMDKTAAVWDTATGKRLAVLQGHEARVNSATFSSDGKLVLTSSDDATARIFDAGTGAEVLAFRGHDSDVSSALFSPDGKSVLTASKDGTARLWNAKTGQQTQILKGHQKEVVSARFSADGKRLVTASFDATARVFDAATGRSVAVLRGHTRELNNAHFSPDGRHVITASDDGSSRLWDAARGKELAVFADHGGPVNAAVFTPAGNLILTASDDRMVRIFDVYQTTQDLIDTVKARTPRCLSEDQRTWFNMRAEVPAWCREGQKWPYETALQK